MIKYHRQDFKEPELKKQTKKLVLVNIFKERERQKEIDIGEI